MFKRNWRRFTQNQVYIKKTFKRFYNTLWYLEMTCISFKKQKKKKVKTYLQICTDPSHKNTKIYLHEKEDNLCSFDNKRVSFLLRQQYHPLAGFFSSIITSLSTSDIISLMKSTWSRNALLQIGRDSAPRQKNEVSR